MRFLQLCRFLSSGAYSSTPALRFLSSSSYLWDGLLSQPELSKPSSNSTYSRIWTGHTTTATWSGTTSSIPLESSRHRSPLSNPSSTGPWTRRAPSRQEGERVDRARRDPALSVITNRVIIRVLARALSCIACPAKAT